MNTYEISNITTGTDTGNRLSNISFILAATTATGQTASAPGSKAYTPVLNTLDTYTPADLAALAQAAVTADKMKEALDLILLVRSTPVPPANLPPAMTTPPTDAEVRARYMVEVDDSIAQIMTKKTRFQLGYAEREKAATVFKAAGYTGDPTDWVSRFATNTGLTNQQAADVILTQAAALHKALHDLDNLRMDKYLIKNAPTLADAQLVFNRILIDRDAIVALIS